MPNPTNPVAANNLQTFTRLAVPLSHEALQPIISDIYNKIAATQGSAQTIAASVPTTATIASIAQGIAGSAAASSTPTALNALIPITLDHPATVSPLSLDTAVVIWNPGGSDTIIYQYSKANQGWAYIAGIVARTQANLATLAGLLTAADTGLLVDVTDFAHILKWTGAAWTYADPSDPAGRIEAFLVDPNPTTGWQLCDGTAAVPYLKADGTTGTQTVPDLVSVPTNAAYLKMGSPASATPNAAVAPVFTGTPETFTTTAVTPIGAVNAFTAPNPYTPAGTNDTSGEPRNLVLRPWMRV